MTVGRTADPQARTSALLGEPYLTLDGSPRRAALVEDRSNVSPAIDVKAFGTQWDAGSFP
jgi:hypothetical protein